MANFLVEKMADFLVEKILNELFDALSAKSQEKFKLEIGIEDEVKNLSTQLRIIKRMLPDVQRRKLKEEHVGIWLEKLEDIAYDIDDVLDEWNTEIQKLKLQADEDPTSLSPPPKRLKVFNDLWNKISPYLPSTSSSSVKQVSGSPNIAQKIKELSKRMEEIYQEANEFRFDLKNLNCTSEEFKRVPSVSIFKESDVCGRKLDKDTIMNKLLSETSNVDDGTCIVSVVGTGGIGKTTLAQLVYNENHIKNHFELKIWICVSNPFDQKRIAKAILEGLRDSSNELSELETMVQRIKETISRKKFLLVLDDVWTENYTEWKPILNSLKDGAQGSRILVTTRSERVARMMDTHYLHQLNELSDSDCWKILSRIAFLRRSKSECEKLEKIGERISKKCKGSPLAASFLGSLLQSKDMIDQWKNVLDSEIWELEESKINLFPHIYLSYKELSAEMRRCFLYCAVFPKDSEIDVEDLIRQWVAQGYLRLSGRVGELELRGYECFSNLAMRSFFQNLERSDPDDGTRISSCKMHDIVHDFAQYLTNGACLTIENLDKVKYLRHGQVRHLTWSCEDDVGLSGNVNNVGKLQSFSSEKIHIVPFDLFDCLKCVRTLRLNKTDLKQVPRAVRNMVHLRFLNMADNGSLEILPEEICELYNLEYLDISGCHKLTQFPQRIGKLINLRELINLGTSGHKQFSQELEKLTSLQRLEEFKVGNGYNKFGQLRNLNELKGQLRILLYDVKVMDSEIAILENKIHIRKLSLEFKYQDLDYGSIMKALQPPANLEALNLFSCPNSKLPGWVMSLNNVKKLTIDGGNVEFLPALGMLPLLEVLELQNLKLKLLSREFLGITCNPANRISFPKLKRLILSNLIFVEEWEDLREEDEEALLVIMPWLEELTLFWCDRLRLLPHRLFRKLAQSIGVLNALLCNDLEKSYSTPMDDFSGRIQFSSMLTKYPQFNLDIQTQLESLPAMVDGIWSNDSNLQLISVTQIRELLPLGKNRVIETVTQSGVVPRLIEFLDRDDYPQLQVEVISILGKVASVSPEYRDLVLGYGALMPLLAQFNEHAHTPMLLGITLTLKIFCQDKPQPRFEQIKPAFPTLVRLLHSSGTLVRELACDVLSYLSNGTNENIEAFIEVGVCPSLVELILRHNSPSLHISALKIICNIVSGDDIHIQDVIQAGIISLLVQHLQNRWFGIQKEAARAISNATSGGTPEQIKYFVSQGCIKPLCDLLAHRDDPSIITDCLKGLENILKVGAIEKTLDNTGDVNVFAQMIDDAEGLRHIENIKSTFRDEIQEKAMKILETYW